MVNEKALRRMVYTATGLVIGVAALSALFVVIPRLAMRPETITDGVDRSIWVFFIIQLMEAAVLLAFIIRSRHGGRKIKGFLYLAGIVAILLGFIWFDGAIYELGTSHGFYRGGILGLVCAGANLIAGILAIIAGKKLRHWSSAK
jgi:hypothetical protein